MSKEIVVKSSNKQENILVRQTKEGIVGLRRPSPLFRFADESIDIPKEMIPDLIDALKQVAEVGDVKRTDSLDEIIENATKAGSWGGITDANEWRKENL